MYSFDSTVRYSEVDRDKNLSIAALVNYFQDCSSFQSESLGVGFDILQDNNKAWVLSYWQIVINNMPKYLDKIKISTWAYAFDNFYGYRNFTMQNEDGTIAACASSIWVFVDGTSMRPIKPDGIFYNAYTIEPKFDKMNYEPRKIITSAKFGEKEPFAVKEHNLDTNNHVNNEQYIQMALDYLPKDFEVRQIRVAYKNSAVLGDTIYPFVQAEAGERFAVDLRNNEGKEFAMVEFARKNA